MLKKQLTDEEKAERKEQATYNRRFAGLKRSIKTEIEEQGVRLVQMRLEFLKEHPQARLPKDYFDHADTVKAIEESIKEYMESIGQAA